MDTDKIKGVFLDELTKIVDADALVVFSAKYLGRRGLLNSLIKDLSKIKDHDKKISHGEKFNHLKNFIKIAITEKKVSLDKTNIRSLIDLTIPGKRFEKGHLHIVTDAIWDIWKIFERLGYVRVSFPEIEWEYFAFDALNMAAGEPARDDFETFFIDFPKNNKYGRMLLTPHTSSGQVRYMQSNKPPIRMINIGKCYRPNWDISHTPMFHQFEGLCVDRGISITNLKGTVEHFAKEYFGKNRKIRLRPYHFQFTEPSFEIDISCGVCGGKGKVSGAQCRLCKSGWLELGGAGMVHPKVLAAGKINANIYSGWAFGFGVERVAMMKDGLKLSDLRILYNRDIRFLEQF